MSLPLPSSPDLALADQPDAWAPYLRALRQRGLSAVQALALAPVDLLARREGAQWARLVALAWPLTPELLDHYARAHLLPVLDPAWAPRAADPGPCPLDALSPRTIAHLRTRVLAGLDSLDRPEQRRPRRGAPRGPEATAAPAAGPEAAADARPDAVSMPDGAAVAGEAPIWDHLFAATWGMATLRARGWLRPDDPELTRRLRALGRADQRLRAWRPGDPALPQLPATLRPPTQGLSELDGPYRLRLQTRALELLLLGLSVQGVPARVLSSLAPSAEVETMAPRDQGLEGRVSSLRASLRVALLAQPTAPESFVALAARGTHWETAVGHLCAHPRLAERPRWRALAAELLVSASSSGTAGAEAWTRLLTAMTPREVTRFNARLLALVPPGTPARRDTRPSVWGGRGGPDLGPQGDVLEAGLMAALRLHPELATRELVAPWLAHPDRERRLSWLRLLGEVQARRTAGGTPAAQQEGAAAVFEHGLRTGGAP